MASPTPPLLKLSLELRLQIYVHLFRDTDTTFYLVQKPFPKFTIEYPQKPVSIASPYFNCTTETSRMISLEDNTKAGKCHSTAILETCRQIRYEALQALFADRVFQYERRGEDLPWGLLPMMQLSGEEMRWIRTVHVIVDQLYSGPRTVLQLFKFLLSAGCRLKRLVLDIAIRTQYRAPVTQLTQDTTIARGITALRIEREIEIRLSDKQSDIEARFTGFVARIADARGWRCYRKLYEDEPGSDSYCVLDKDGRWHWGWYVRPPATSTKVCHYLGNRCRLPPV